MKEMKALKNHFCVCSRTFTPFRGEKSMCHAQPTPECMACQSEANCTSVIGLKVAEADFTSIFSKKTPNISPI